MRRSGAFPSRLDFYQPAPGASPRRSRETVLQREFALFGGEFLLTLGAKDLRAWFAAFFAVDEDVWGGFLGGWPGLPGNHHHETRLGRLLFGLALFCVEINQ